MSDSVDVYDEEEWTEDRTLHCLSLYIIIPQAVIHNGVKLLTL